MTDCKDIQLSLQDTLAALSCFSANLVHSVATGRTGKFPAADAALTALQHHANSLGDTLVEWSGPQKAAALTKALNNHSKQLSNTLKTCVKLHRAESSKKVKPETKANANKRFNDNMTKLKDMAEKAGSALSKATKEKMSESDGKSHMNKYSDCLMEMAKLRNEGQFDKDMEKLREHHAHSVKMAKELSDCF